MSEAKVRLHYTSSQKLLTPSLLNFISSQTTESLYCFVFSHLQEILRLEPFINFNYMDLTILLTVSALLLYLYYYKITPLI